MRIICHTASSLDGYLADPDQNLSWLFAQEHVEPDDPDLRLDTLLDRAQAIFMGSTTFLWVRDRLGATEWPYRQPTWVLSHQERAPIAGVDRVAGCCVRLLCA